HGSMEAYAQAKAQLFDSPGLACAVLNLDDAMGVRLAQRLEGSSVRVIGYSVSGAHSGREHLAATRVGHGEMEIESSWGRATARVNQVGRFNMANALGLPGRPTPHCLAFPNPPSL